MTLTKLDEDGQTHNINSYQDKIDDMESTIAGYKKQLYEQNRYQKKIVAIRQEETQARDKYERRRLINIVLILTIAILTMVGSIPIRSLSSASFDAQDIVIMSGLILVVGVVLVLNERTKWR
jgi:hypothetical protein